jgi:hypothetical protein
VIGHHAPHACGLRLSRQHAKGQKKLASRRHPRLHYTAAIPRAISCPAPDPVRSYISRKAVRSAWRLRRSRYRR